MIKNRYTKAAACAVLAVSMIFTGCGKKEGTKTADKKAETTKTIRLERGDITANSYVIKVGNAGVQYSEVLNYCYLLKNQYESSFGSELWKYKIDDKTTIGDKAKKEIVSTLTQLKLIGWSGSPGSSDCRSGAHSPPAPPGGPWQCRNC